METVARPLERSGWSRIDNSEEALDVVERTLRSAGVEIEPLDLGPWATSFRAFRHLTEYDGEYRIYGGLLEHCLWEKALEHFLSFVCGNPQPGMTVVDVGSCRSVAPAILRRVFSVRCFEQDLEYPAGVHGNRVGSSADSIPLPDASVDLMTLHCTFEHFEGSADTGFVRESRRLLKPGGKTVILPLYLNRNFCNITGETEPRVQSEIAWDADAAHHCLIPEWQNRFGRHYSADAFLKRVAAPSHDAGLKLRLLRVRNWEAIDERLWLRWVLILER